MAVLFALLGTPVLFEVVLSLLLVLWLAWVVESLVQSPLRSIPCDWKTRLIPFKSGIDVLMGNGHRAALAQHTAYGGLVRVDARTIRVADPALAMKILRIDDVPKSSFYDKLRVFGDGAGNLVTFTDPAHHRNVRLRVSPAFSIKYLAGTEPLVSEVWDDLEAKIDETAGQEGSDGWAILDLNSYFHYIGIDVIGRVAFGTKLDMVRNGQHPFYASLREMLVWVAAFLAFPFLSVHKWSRPMQLKALQDVFFDELTNDRHVMNQRGQRRDDILQFLVDAGESQHQMRDHNAILMSAGSETTANTMHWAVYFLLHTPRALAALRAELDAAFPSPAAFSSHLPLSRLKTLPYLAAVIKETLRIRPVVSKVSRELQEDTTFVAADAQGVKRSYAVPRGTTVDVSIYSLHRSPHLWLRADEFWPERWLKDALTDEEAWGAGNEDDKADVHAAHAAPDEGYPRAVVREAFMPFSMGSRDCLGRNFAWNEMRIILGHLIRRYDIEAAFDLSDSINEGTEFVTVHNRRKGGLPVKLRLRK